MLRDTPGRTAERVSYVTLQLFGGGVAVGLPVAAGESDLRSSPV